MGFLYNENQKNLSKIKNQGLQVIGGIDRYQGTFTLLNIIRGNSNQNPPENLLESSN